MHLSNIMNDAISSPNSDEPLHVINYNNLLNETSLFFLFPFPPTPFTTWIHTTLVRTALIDLQPENSY